MGRFERKILKTLKKQTPSFDNLYSRINNEVDKTHDNFDCDNNGNVKVKRLNKSIFIYSCMLLIALLFISIVIICNFKNNVIDSDPLFGDEAVYNIALEDSKIESLTNEFPIIDKIEYLSGTQIYHIVDDSLVFSIVEGEIETETNYYLLTIQIEHNKSYQFLNKENFLQIENEFTKKGYDIGISFVEIDEMGLYWYRMKTEASGQRIFWDIKCIDNSINELIEKLFN